MTEEKKPFFVDKFDNYYGNYILTPTARAAWCYLDKPSTFGPNPKYSITLLFDPSDALVANGLAAIEAMYAEMLHEKYGPNVPALEIPCIKDGDDSKFSKYQGFAGMLHLTAKNARQPEVFDRMKKKVEPASILAGMKVRAVITPMLCTKGAAYKLERVQFVSDDGVRFFSGADPTSLLDAIGDDNPATFASVNGASAELPSEKAPLPQDQETIAVQAPLQQQSQSAAQKKLQEQLAKAKAAPKVIGAVQTAAPKKGIGAALNRL